MFPVLKGSLTGVFSPVVHNSIKKKEGEGVDKRRPETSLGDLKKKKNDNKFKY